MDPFGAGALVVASAAGAAGALAPAQRRVATRALLAISLAAWWFATGVLAQRFLAVDLRLVEVAALTRDEVPWSLRLAGTWAGPAGSALVWFALVLTATTVAARGAAQRVVAAASAVAGLAVLVVAGPFDRVAEPVLAGVGLSPVLEHPMMLVHPPLLYTSQAAVLVAALGGARTGRRRAALAAGLLTVSSLLGAWWAHDELGWGGWWAWDPVENTALAPLVALLASLHATTGQVATTWRRVAAVAVLAGIALTRSGLPDSVHAFSSGAGLAATFAVAACLAAAATVVAARRDPLRVDAAPAGPAVAPLGPRRIAGVVVGWGAGWVLVVVGSAGIAAAVLGAQDPPAAVDGAALGRLVAPVGIALAIGVILWGFRRGARWSSLAAHGGAVVFAVGVAGSLAGTVERAGAEVGTPVEVGGSTVLVTEMRVVEQRSDVVRLEVAATIDGRELTAAVLDHPDLARTRARPGRLLDPFAETELVVARVRGERVSLELRRHPGLPWVWTGGALCAVGLLAAAQSRRRRFASSSESSVEPEPAGGAAGAAGADGAAADGAVGGGGSGEVGVGVGGAPGPAPGEPPRPDG